MRAYDVIRKKRDGGELGRDEIGFLIDGALSGEVADYQLSAFLMAVYLKGMTGPETVLLTEAMLGSGGRVDLSDVHGTKVDKHSTGGVGDKLSLVLGPIAASMGIKVPMLSGRGLGHTGGTLDKLESVPGLRTDLSVQEFKENLRTVGFSVMGVGEAVAPADGKLYALRDVTATVDSVPLIASSIMSKKLAEGAEGLVLDVKAGSGAFMKDLEDARRLARTMVDIGNSMGVTTVALITSMDQPLGRTVGNALELKEAISFLRGSGAEDLSELTYVFSAWMLNVADSVTEELPVGKMTGQTMRRLRHETMEFIEKGDAYKKLAEFVDAQEGDPECVFTPARLPTAKNVHAIELKDEGYVMKLDALCVGRAAVLLGAGRERAGDTVDHAAGIVLNKKVGDLARHGEGPFALLHYNDDTGLKEAEDIFLGGIELGPREPARRRPVLEVVMPEG